MFEFRDFCIRLPKKAKEVFVLQPAETGRQKIVKSTCGKLVTVMSTNGVAQESSLTGFEALGAAAATLGESQGSYSYSNSPPLPRRKRPREYSDDEDDFIENHAGDGERDNGTAVRDESLSLSLVADSEDLAFIDDDGAAQDGF